MEDERKLDFAGLYPSLCGPLANITAGSGTGTGYNQAVVVGFDPHARLWYYDNRPPDRNPPRRVFQTTTRKHVFRSSGWRLATSSWHCAVEDVEYLRTPDGYEPESNQWVDARGQRIIHQSLPYVIGAVVRIWQRNRVPSLRDLCLRRLRALPVEDQAEMYQQFMGVATLPEVLSNQISPAVTVQRVLRLWYDRFLITHHYMSRRSPQRHLACFGPNLNIPETQPLSAVVQCSSIVATRCGFASWLQYNRMRSEMHLLCLVCQTIAEKEILDRLCGHDSHTELPQTACTCDKQRLTKTIWQRNEFRLYILGRAGYLTGSLSRYCDWLGEEPLKQIRMVVSEPEQTTVQRDVVPVAPPTPVVRTSPPAAKQSLRRALLGTDNAVATSRNSDHGRKPRNTDRKAKDRKRR